MTDLPVADVALARRLEEISVARLTGYVQAAIAQHPPGAPQPPVLLKVAESACAWMGAGSPVNRCTGLGMHGAVTGEQLDEVEAFFNERSAPARVMLCPLADASLLALLQRRGYRLDEFQQMFAMRLPPDFAPVIPAGVTVVQLAPDLLEEWIDVSGAEEDGSPPSAESRAIARPNGASGILFRASVEGQPVGGAALYMDGDGATLGGAGVLPAFRKRGIHSALIQARLHAAAQLGARIVSFGCEPGSASGRNAARNGFWLAYTSARLIRDERPG